MKLFSRQKEIIIHVMYWMIFFFTYFIQLKPENDFIFGFDEVTLFSISYLFITISTFYLNYLYILKKFVDIKILSKFPIGLFLIFAYFITFRYLLEEVLFLHVFGTGNYFEGTTIQYYIFDNLHYPPPKPWQINHRLAPVYGTDNTACNHLRRRPQCTFLEASRHRCIHKSRFDNKNIDALGSQTLPKSREKRRHGSFRAPIKIITGPSSVTCN